MIAIEVAQFKQVLLSGKILDKKRDGFRPNADGRRAASGGGGAAVAAVHRRQLWSVPIKRFRCCVQPERSLSAYSNGK